MTTIQASVTMFWEPFGLDVDYEPGTPGEGGRLENIIGLCGDVHTVISRLFPKEKHQEVLTDFPIEIASDASVVLAKELDGPINDRLMQFDVSADELASLREETASNRIRLNSTDGAEGSQRAIRFSTELAATGNRARYYYLGPEGQTYCCNTSSVLLADGQPVRVRSDVFDGEAHVHLRTKFVLIQPA